MQSKKTSVMTTRKHLGAHIWQINWQIVMVCFHLLHSGYDAEVIILVYDMETILLYFFLLLVDIVLGDLYFDSHLLLYLIITLILITYS